MLKILICQPDQDYFIWQLKAQMYNFHNLGVEQDAIILLGFVKRPNDNAIKFARKTKATVYFIEDKRSRPLKYAPNIVPHLCKEFFKRPFKDKFLYLGDDCLFTKKFTNVNFDGVVLGDVSSYISAPYIIKRSEDVFYKMCGIVGIDPEIVKSHIGGGAQHLFNVVPPLEYWEKVEQDSERLLELLNNYNNSLPDKRIQAWTAGMWGILWNLWYYKIETKVATELNHAWPNTPMKDMEKFNFFHNAGVTSLGEMFYKGEYRFKEPDTLEGLNKELSSFWYADQVIKGLDFFKNR